MEIGNDVAHGLVIAAHDFSNLARPLASRTGEQNLAPTEDKRI
jgi:hypothetical protein